MVAKGSELKRREEKRKKTRQGREERDTLTDSLQGAVRQSGCRSPPIPPRPVRVALESGEGSGSEEEGNALQRREKELVKGVDVAAGFAHSLILAHSGQFSTRVVFSFCFMLRSWSSTRCLERNGCLSQ